jgi:hypothetical protein
MVQETFCVSVLASAFKPVADTAKATNNPRIRTLGATLLGDHSRLLRIATNRAFWTEGRHAPIVLWAKAKPPAGWNERISVEG